MKHMKQALIVLMILISQALVFAVEFDLDYASFRVDDNTNVVEVYLLIPRNLFKFVPVEGSYKSSALVRVALAQNDTVVAMDEWTFNDQLADTTQEIGHQRIPEISVLQAPPGEYTIITLVADVTNGKQYKYESNIILKDYSMQELDASDVHISAQISKTNQKNKFSKYFGYDMIPNASSIFGPSQPMIYGVCEVYNLDFSEGSGGSYQTQYSIQDINGETLKTLGWKTKPKPGNSAVEINGINIVTLESGIYDFKIEVVDDQTGKNVVRTKRFYIMRETNPEKMRAIMEQAMLNEYDDEDLEKIFGPMKYLATELEKKQFKKSDKEGKIRILSSFWKNRDTDVSTEVNEAKAEFERRLRYTNEHFFTARKEGWQSEMGRVLIVYGFPSEVERFPSSLETKPYQIWHYYEIEGGVEFVFIDKSGFGTMELVHSSARNELQDAQWRRYIEPTSSSGNVVY